MDREYAVNSDQQDIHPCPVGPGQVGKAEKGPYQSGQVPVAWGLEQVLVIEKAHQLLCQVYVAPFDAYDSSHPGQQG